MNTFNQTQDSPFTDNDIFTIKEVLIEDRTDSEEDESSSSSSEIEIDDYKRPSFMRSPEYYHIQKLMKFLKSGNISATTISLCCLRDHDLTDELLQFAIQDCGGIEVLVNLLDTKELECKLGALSILIDMAQNEKIRKALVDIGCMPLLVKNLLNPAMDLKILVGEVMYHLGFLAKARKDARHHNGIPLLVDLLDVDKRILRIQMNDLTPFEQQTVRLTRSAALALWSLSKCKKNRLIMMKCGSVPLMANLLGSIHTDMMIPTLGTLSHCAELPGFQMAVWTERMVGDIVKHLYEENTELQRYCCETIFHAAEEAATRDMLREAKGLRPLVTIISDPRNAQNKDLLAAATGAIWKAAMTPENIRIFDKLQTINVLVELLENPNEDDRILSNVVGALYEFLKFPHNRDILRRAGGVPHFVNLLNYTYQPLLENLPMVLSECANDEDCMRIIEDLDGVRLIWSLLKNKCHTVQANAAMCLVPCIRFSEYSGEMVRSLIGGMELIVDLLESSEDVKVLGSICAAIAEIAKNIENLAVLTDFGIVSRLVALIDTEDVFLREHLCSAIGYCCAWGSNCKIFGRLGAITPLVGFLADNNEKVNRTAAIALYHLSKNEFNCITMHESGVVVFLLKIIRTENDCELQDAAAGCLANLRKLAFKAETIHLIRKGDSSCDEEDED